MKIKRKLADMIIVGGTNIFDAEFEIELSRDEIKAAYECKQDEYYRSDAMRHLSETLSDGEVIDYDYDIEGFLRDLDDEHKAAFKEKYGIISIEEALDPNCYDLVGKIVDKFDELYDAAQSDWDRWEDAVKIELQELANRLLESKGPYVYHLTQKVGKDDDNWYPKVPLGDNSCIGATNYSPIGIFVEKKFVDSGTSYGQVSYKLPLSKYELRDYPELVPGFDQ